jgi:hypothetical protein
LEDILQGSPLDVAGQSTGDLLRAISNGAETTEGGDANNSIQGDTKEVAAVDSRYITRMRDYSVSKVDETVPWDKAKSLAQVSSDNNDGTIEISGGRSIFSGFGARIPSAFNRSTAEVNATKRTSSEAAVPDSRPRGSSVLMKVFSNQVWALRDILFSLIELCLFFTSPVTYSVVRTPSRARLLAPRR